jgi:hypothetical protein
MNAQTVMISGIKYPIKQVVELEDQLSKKDEKVGRLMKIVKYLEELL